ELLGQTFVDNTCTPSEQAFLIDSARRGRVIASGSAYEACIRTVMAGPTVLAGDSSLSSRVTGSTSVGPYFPCAGDPASAGAAGTVVGLSRSNLPVAIGCKPSGSTATENAFAMITTNPGPPRR